MQIEHTIRDGVHRYLCWGDYGCSVVASAVSVEEDDHVYLKDINLGPAYRGHGIGTRLLEQIKEDFSERDLVANVFEARVPWYRRQGFEPFEMTNNLVKIVRSF